MLNIASSQTDMGDKKAAKATLESLVAKYPDAPAATTARDRIPTLR
jgi:TolA-binding protein